MTLPSEAEVQPVLLEVLAAMGRARPRDVYPRITERFPGIEPADLTETVPSGDQNRWQNRIQWARNSLAEQGLLDRSERGWWMLTEAGFEAAGRSRSDAPSVSSLDLVPPSPDSSARGDPEMEVLEQVEISAPAIAMVPTESERIATELVAAARDSSDSDRLERAVGDALTFLGFDVDVIGGSGKTDVLAVAPLGVDRYRVVFDAKSTASGAVANTQIDWLSIRKHREDERADHACVVGPDFAGGQLRDRAAEFDTSLLTAAELAELVGVHAVTPVVLTDLRPLFGSAPLASKMLPQVRAAAEERARRLRLLVRLLEYVDTWNAAQPGLVLAKPDTLFGSVLAGTDPGMQGTTLDDVRRALELLERLGVLRRANEEGYVSQTSLRGAFQVLAALGDLARTQAEAQTQTDRGSLPGRDLAT